MTSTQEHKDFIEKHGGVFNVHVIGRHLGWNNGDILDKKADALNGQVNYNRPSKSLSVEQLKVLLPTFINGRRQVQGERRERIESFLNAVGSPVEAQPKEYRYTNNIHSKKISNEQARPKRKSGRTVVEEQPSALLKDSFIKKPWFVKTVAITTILIQCAHFAIYYAETMHTRDAKIQLPLWLIILFAVFTGLCIESMGLVLVGNGKSKTWLKVIAVMSFAINCLLHEVYNSNGWDVVGQLIICMILPVGIYMFSELFIEKLK